MTFKDLQTQFIIAAYRGKPVTITLSEDAVAGLGDKLIVPEGADVTVDLNGCTIWCNDNIEVQGALTVVDSRGSGQITGSVYTGVYVNRGDFTLEGGSICGNLYGGVYVNSGKFKMKGGAIYNNKNSGVMINNASFFMSGGIIDSNISRCGGGVYVGNEGDFTMKGGFIIENEATFKGGGVFVSDDAYFIMNGGTISDNAARYTGSDGVYVAEKGYLNKNGGRIRNSIRW